MLELKNIVKIYPAGGEDVEALRGVSLRFRKSEFVSILGPSGCGKTTLLNIMGGLDQYTEGDLAINGRSTKDFRDRDWDAYRNHSVGFVFQTYNLIPHQSVLQNVEIALTLSGVSKRERRRRAVEALEQVGLKDQMRKRPAEMSGGQMQRVAIARAIVNDPDIVMADEPTGALDTETSLQVMDILKKIAQDRLVIMVTHNPDLAERYSTRIIRMLDGKITDDSGAPTDEEMEAEAAEARKKAEEAEELKRPSMSLRTAFGLSLKNLFTKKGRTILTSFAGSIGIIGIALIYAVSHGMTAYINTVQEDTLSSYPLMLQAQHVDSSSLLTTFLGKAKSMEEHGDDGVYRKAIIYEMMNALTSAEQHENDLRSFKAWLEKERADRDSVLHDAVSAVQYTYDASLTVYTRNVDGKIIASDLQQLMQTMMGEYLQTDFTGLFALRDETMNTTQSAMMNSLSLWREMLPGDNGRLISPLLEKQYDVVYGSWPDRYDEAVLVLDEDGELSDMALYALGLLPKEDIDSIMKSVFAREEIKYENKKWTYEEICGTDYRVVPASECYAKDEATGLYTDLRQTDAGLQYLYDNGLRIRISGVIRPSADAVATMMNGGIAYTSALTEYMTGAVERSEAVQAQKASPGTDIFTGLPFGGQELQDEAAKAKTFREYIASLDEDGKAQAWIRIRSNPTDEEIRAAAEEQLAALAEEELNELIVKGIAAQTGMSESMIRAYLDKLDPEQLKSMVLQATVERIRGQYEKQIRDQLAAAEPAELAAELDAAVKDYTDERCAELYGTVLTFSGSTYEKNLKTLGVTDPDAPATINLYAATFADKDRIEKAIAEYNRSVDDLSAITYTDYVGLIMSSVTTIIDAITYVLIAFVAISLIVSSIMIGVITLISVQERTKEIGILRSLGASKRNVSSMFNAETVIIGFASGLLGVTVTWLLCIPINLILHRLTGISGLSAQLPVSTAAVLVTISMLLTLIAGIIPSRSAAKKDPVVALRTE